MINYGLLDKVFIFHNRITCILGRSAIVKFYVYTIGKAIFCIESII